MSSLKRRPPEGLRRRTCRSCRIQPSYLQDNCGQGPRALETWYSGNTSVRLVPLSVQANPSRLLGTPVVSSIGRSHAIDLEMAFRTDIPGEALRPASRPLVGDHKLAALGDELPADADPGVQIVGGSTTAPGPWSSARLPRAPEEHRGCRRPEPPAAGNQTPRERRRKTATVSSRQRAGICFSATKGAARDSGRSSSCIVW